jgi:TPR repeat protein
MNPMLSCGCALWIAIGCIAPVRGEVGPEALDVVSWDDLNKVRRYYDRMRLVAADGNHVAWTIADELKTVLWMDPSYSTPPNGKNDPIIWNGTEVERDWFAEVERRAAAGDPFYMTVIGKLCQGHQRSVAREMKWIGIDGAVVDQQKVLRWWKKADKLNFGLAQFKLGCYYISARCPNRDDEKSAEYFQKAANWGVPAAWYWLGNLYAGGTMKAGTDEKRAMECWRKAADANHPEAQYELGWRYLYGSDCVKPDKELGLRLMSSSAAAGFHSAKLRLDWFTHDYLNKTPPVRTLPCVIQDQGTEVVSTYIASNAVMANVKQAKVSIVCFIDVYAAQSGRSANLTPATPSQGLDRYLSGVRTLKHQEGGQRGRGAINPQDVRIFIVECWDETWWRVRLFDREIGLKDWDGSFPVIYVFHDGRCVQRYMYERSPGEQGEELKALVEELLSGGGPEGRLSRQVGK